jgi:4-amino-4-deoxy-L-arabinose transferase-like glycosyltransferase
MVSQKTRKRRIVYLLAVMAASYLFFFYHLGSYSLKEPDEGRYAEIPREMVEQGDYVVPHLNYVRWFEKPPLLYWVTAASYKAFGISEWSFRYPNALAAMSCVLMIYLFVSRWFGHEVGRLSSLILSSSFGFFATGHIVTMDMLFSVLLFGGLLCFYQYYRDKKQLFLYLFFAALGLAVLAKGPVALIITGVTIFFFLYFEKKLVLLRDMVRVKPLLLFTIIAASWFIFLSFRETGFFQLFFVDQNILRFLTTKHKRSGPLYYFIPVLFGGLFPWSIFIPRAVVTLWRTEALRLFFIWSLVVFVFFSISGSKLPTYILPIFPAISVILACLFGREWRSRVPPKPELIVYVAFFLCLALGGFACGSGMLDRYMAGTPDIAAIVANTRWLALSLCAISLLVLGFLCLPTMRSFQSLFYALCAFSLVVFAGLMLHVRVIDAVDTTKALALEINRLGGSTTMVINYGSFDRTLPFYLKRRTYLADFVGELDMGSRDPDAQEYFLNPVEAVRLFRGDRPVFVVAKARRIPELERLGIKGTRLLCQDKWCLVANGLACKMTEQHGATASPDCMSNADE